MKFRQIGVAVAAFIIATGAMAISVSAAEKNTTSSTSSQVVQVQKATSENSISKTQKSTTLVKEAAQAETVSQNTNTTQKENGVDLSKNGWQKVDGKYYYVKNGKLLESEWLNENGKIYYLDYDGAMLSDQFCGLYDEKTNKYYSYHFNKDGSATIGWYREVCKGEVEDTNNLYYFGTNGAAYTGINKIGDETYCFASYGNIITDKYEIDNTNVYYFGYDGKATAKVAYSGNGWVKINDHWVYVKNREILKDQWINHTYYVGDNGVMYSNQEELFKNSDHVNVYYRFNGNGAKIIGWYKDPYGDWYYYNEDGESAYNVENINGIDYLFNYKGSLSKDNRKIIDDVLYVTDSSGKVTQKISSSNKGWQEVCGDWYYSDGDHFYCSKMLNYKNQDYYFDSDGIMEKDKTKTSINSSSSDYFYGSLDSQGHLIKNGWSQAYGRPWAWCYSDDQGKILQNTWQLYNNVWYYFNDSGWMCTNVNLIDGNYQLFKEDGKWIGRMTTASGWCLAGGKYYYIENSKPCKGWKTIGGLTYYFDNDGKMLSYTHKYIDDNDYAFCKNGNLIKSAWVNVGSPLSTYYDVFKGYADKDGKLFKGWHLIDNKWYFFQNDGYLRTYSFVENGVMEIIDANGVYQRMVKQENANGWFNLFNRYQYYHNGFKLKGWQKINNVYYYFDQYGDMLEDQDEVIDGKLYYFDKNGAWVNKTGWINDGKMYANNGVLLTCWQKIDGKWYYFTPYKVKSCIYKVDDIYYRFNDSGVEVGAYKVQNGWQKVDGQWYYGENGDLVSGNKVISGKLYMFFYPGYMIANCLNEDYPVYHGADGSPVKNQWIKFSGFWFYANELGKLYTSETRVINGTTYSFDQWGRMV